jgi:hypothetical protein
LQKAALGCNLCYFSNSIGKITWPETTDRKISQARCFLLLRLTVLSGLEASGSARITVAQTPTGTQSMGVNCTCQSTLGRKFTDNKTKVHETCWSSSPEVHHSKSVLHFVDHLLMPTMFFYRSLTLNQQFPPRWPAGSIQCPLCPPSHGSCSCRGASGVDRVCPRDRQTAVIDSPLFINLAFWG